MQEKCPNCGVRAPDTSIEYHEVLHSTFHSRAVARGSTFTCFVDGKQVGTITDTHSSRGLVGLSVVDPGVDVAFTNFSVAQA